MPLGKLSFLHMLFLENEEQTSGMFFYSIKNLMQKFMHFGGEKEKTQNRHLAWFCTHPLLLGFVIGQEAALSLSDEDNLVS